MKKLLFLLILISPLAFSYNALRFCGSVGKYYLKNYCPPDLVLATAGQNKTNTAADGSITVDSLSTNFGTVNLHACAYDTVVPDRTYAQIIAGTNCSSKRVKSISSDGTYTFTGVDKFTGLDPGTSYKVAYAVNTASISNVVGVSGVFTTTSTGVGGTPIDQNGSHFVDSIDGGGGGEDGSFATPWDSINDVNLNVFATSEDVYFKAGTTYNGELTIDWAGTSNDNVIVGCYYIDNGAPYECGTTQVKPKIIANTAVTGRALNANANYLTVQGLEFDGASIFSPVTTGNYFVIQVFGDYVTFDNVSVLGWGSKAAATAYALAHQYGGRLGGVRFTTANNFTIRNSTITSHYSSGVKITDCALNGVIETSTIGYNASGDAIRIDACRNAGGPVTQGLLIQNNTLEGGGSSDAIQTNNSYFDKDIEDIADNWGGVIRNNLIIREDPGTNENAIDLKGANYWLVEGNVIWGHTGDNNGSLFDTPDRNTFTGCVTSGYGFNSAAAPGEQSNVVSRLNICYDNAGGFKNIKDFVHVQNTVVGNNRDFGGPDQPRRSGMVPFPASGGYGNNTVLGNIISDHKGYLMTLSTWNDTYIDQNVYYQGSLGSANFNLDRTTNYTSLANWQSALAGDASIRGNDTNSVVGDPGFANIPSPVVGSYDSMDWRTSGVGENLLTHHTLTDGSGASQVTVTVDNACVFFDGFGVPGVEPDYIKIGTNNYVQIEAGTLDCSTQTFDIVEQQSWGNNENVIRTDSSGNPLNDAGACQNGVCPLDEQVSPPPPPTGVKKWNPGHYMMLTGALSNDLDQTSRFADYDAIGNETAVKGVTLRTSWASLERDTKGNYQPGFDWIHAELDYLAALPEPKRLWIRIQDKGKVQNTFSCYDGTYDFPLTDINENRQWTPKYIRALGNGTWLNTAGNICYPRLWETEIMNHYIDMLTAYGNEFNDHPLFEGISLNQESAPGLNASTEYPGWSTAKVINEWTRAGQAAQSAFPNTNVVYHANSLINQSSVESLMEGMRSVGVGQGGPDLAPECLSADLDCIGGFATPQTGSGGCCENAYNYVYNNYNQSVPVSYSIEISELGNGAVGRGIGYSPTALYNFCTQWGLNCNHMFWHRNTYTGTLDQQWDTGILPFIQANPNLIQSCPTSYLGCIIGDVPPTPGDTTTLTVSANGRYFEKDNQPFLWIGDTGWYQRKLSEADIKLYLEDRAIKGFNVIQGPILLGSPQEGTWPKISDYTGLDTNFYGFQPLTNDDPVTLNENYWQFIDYIVNKANSLGLFIALPIVWGNDLDILFTADAAGNIQADKLGELIATRYNTYDNIIWFVTGEWQKIAWQSEPRDDTTPSAAEIALIRALAGGINDHKKSTQLMSIHPDAIADATNEFKADAWLDFNQFEAYVLTQNSVNFTTNTYNYSPTKPTVSTEPGYEGLDTVSPPVDDWIVRIQAWTSILSGARGATYGAWNVWRFDLATWKNSLNLPGTLDYIVMKDLLNNYNWHLLAPTQSMITSSTGSASNQTYIAASRTTNNTQGIIYSSIGNSFNLDLTDFTGPVIANWVNPRTGDFTLLGTYSNALGNQVFDPPGAPGSGNDWVLVLEVQ